MYGDLLRKKLGDKPYLIELYEKAGVLTGKSTKKIESSLDEDWYSFEFEAPKREETLFEVIRRRLLSSFVHTAQT